MNQPVDMTLFAYRALRSSLIHERWMNRGRESDHENHILDLMDGLWAGLSEEDRASAEADDLSPPCDFIDDLGLVARAVEIGESSPPR